MIAFTISPEIGNSSDGSKIAYKCQDDFGIPRGNSSQDWYGEVLPVLRDQFLAPFGVRAILALSC